MKKHIQVAAVVVRRGEEVLLATRPGDKPPFGLEFPGGKLETGETLKQAAEREMREELGVAVSALDEIFRVSHETETAVILLRFIRAMLPPDQTPMPQEGQTAGWYRLRGDAPFGLLAPDIPVWNFLKLGE